MRSRCSCILTLYSVEEVMMNETGSLSTNANAAAAEPWQRHNGRLFAMDSPFIIDLEPPESEEQRLEIHGKRKWIARSNKSISLPN